MCGVIELLALKVHNTSVSKESLQRIVPKLQHRGQDAMGLLFIDDQGFVCTNKWGLSQRFCLQQDQDSSKRHVYWSYTLCYNGIQ